MKVTSNSVAIKLVKQVKITFVKNKKYVGFKTRQ